MKFYRRLQPIKAISFDLDDTLYSNGPIMKVTGQAMIDFFSERLETQQLCDINFWQPFKQQALAEQPELIHDVGLVREKTYFLGATAMGLNAQQAQLLTDDAMACFNHHRSNFTVPSKSIALLAKLAEKFPLISISNGNVDTKNIGIDHFFTHIYHANLANKHKPHATMFNRCSQAMNLAPHHILHVGDCGIADIQGAMLAGFQSAWLPKYQVGRPLKILPHLELSDIEQLTNLL